MLIQRLTRAVALHKGGTCANTSARACQQAGLAPTAVLRLQLGAYVNETFQAREGFAPDLFPEEVPVYMGHYHKPHTVQGTSIEYIGSPYQGLSAVELLW